MKRQLMTLTCLLVSLVLTAATLTKDEARQKALQFLNERGGSVAAARGMQQVKLQLNEGVVADQLYVFNVGQREGFVIVSGDDCTGDVVLGYADKGEIVAENMPANLKGWLQGYADQISWMREHGVTNDVAAARALTATSTRTPVAEQLTCRWNQSAPYNNYCPVIINSKSQAQNAATGCVATAVAQVLYYRLKSVGSTTTLKAIPAYESTQTALYEWNDAEHTSYSSVSSTIAEKPIRTFYWSKMADTYPSSDAEATEEVARLMEYVGAGVEMQYDEQSGAYSEGIPSLLADVFDIKGTSVVYRNNYTYADWLDIIYRELTTNGPVLFSGQSTGGGHQFVIDGFDEEDYFYVNWGWGGYSNGFFKLSVLYSDQQGIGGSTSQDGFSARQLAIVGVETPTKLADVTLTCSPLATSGNEVGSPVTVTATLTNSSSNIYSGDLSLMAVIDGNKEDTKLLATKQLEIAAGTNTDVVFTFTPEATGSYELQVVDKTDELLADKTITVVAATPTPTPTSTTGTLTTNVKGSAPYDLTIDNGVGTLYHQGFYGSTLKGHIKLTNTSETDAHTSGIIVRIWQYNGVNYGYLDEKLYATDIAKDGGTQTVDFEFTDLTVGTSYLLTFYYSDYSAIASTYSFDSKYGVTTYAADGTETTVAPTATATMPADAVAMDIANVATVTTVVPNSNPNALYFVGAPVPSGLEGKNVVQSGVAATLALTDGYAFYSPVDFTATTATYTRTFTTGADGTGGWSTIILPFDVTTVKQGSTVIDWFHSGSDTGKNFWLKNFSSEDGSTVNFGYADKLEANTPYLIAVPGDKWGAAWDLTSKAITFEGSNVDVTTDAVTVSGNNYKFLGTLVPESVTDGYVLNGDGDAFAKTTTTVEPFRAYFKSIKMLAGAVGQLYIGSENGGATGISAASMNKDPMTNEVFDLQGRRVAQPTKGLYIKHGKKVIIK